MKKILGLIILVPFSCFSQVIGINNLEGLWKYNQSEVDYIIFKGDSLIWLGFFDLKKANISVDKIGFVDRNNPELLRSYREEFSLKDSTEVRLLNYALPSSLFYLVEDMQLDENDYFYWGGTLCYLGLDEVPPIVGTRFELINANVFGFTKVSNLPNIYLSALYIRSKTDKRNYCIEFFGKEIKLIKTKSTIHSQLNQPTKMYLIKGDPVEIVDKKDGWLKIKYYPEKDCEWTGETIEGWIRKEDVE